MSAASTSWIEKTRFELWKKTARINWARLPVGAYQVDAGALPAPTPRPAGHAIRLFAASVAAKSALPAGKRLLLRMCATRSAACSEVNFASSPPLAAWHSGSG